MTNNININMSKHSVDDLADDPENERFTIDMTLKHIDDETCKLVLNLDDYSDLKSVVLMLEKVLEAGMDRGYETCQMDLTSFDWFTLKPMNIGWKEVDKDDSINTVTVETKMEKFSELFAKSLDISK